MNFARLLDKAGTAGARSRGCASLCSAFDARIVEANSLAREGCAERVRTCDDAANAVVNEAFAELGTRAAKDEALWRTYEASGQSVEAFADMYGMDVRAVTRSVVSARSRFAVRGCAGG